MFYDNGLYNKKLIYKLFIHHSYQQYYGLFNSTDM